MHDLCFDMRLLLIMCHCSRWARVFSITLHYAWLDLYHVCLRMLSRLVVVGLDCACAARVGQLLYPVSSLLPVCSTKSACPPKACLHPGV